ncbi:hypothetical protein [Streptomyces sp. NPDC101455]|uniref:hypothetical protein n=1 Tax=Streptomyces sp. NPDC101455 TaxID=3366142 RepID=UPI003808648D
MSPPPSAPERKLLPAGRIHPSVPRSQTAETFLQWVLSGSDPAREQRGFGYAVNGAVTALVLEPAGSGDPRASLTASVTGNRPHPYDVYLVCDPLDEDEWHLDAPPAADARPDDSAGRFPLLHEQVDPIEDARRSVIDSREDLEDASAVLRSLLPGPPAAHLCAHPRPPAPPLALGPTRHAAPQPPATAVDDATSAAHQATQKDLLVRAAGPVLGVRAVRHASQPRPWAAGCAGQQRLEHHLLMAIAESTDCPDRNLEQFLHITRALAGPACLHLAMDGEFLPHVLDRLLPTLQRDGSLDGMPGLRRLPGGDPHTFSLVPLGGHGRLVLHLDRDAYDTWTDHEIDSDLLYRVACTAACPPAPCPRQHLAAADRPLEHLLHSQPRLHPAETALLHAGHDPALSASASRQLRHRLAPLPAPDATTGHPAAVPVTLTAPAVRPVPPSLPGPGPAPAELPPGLFTRAGTGRTVDELAQDLARRLLVLLAEGTARPGDVLYDLPGIAQNLGGPRATANGTLILRRTAVRYGLVRNRPRHPSDPPGPLPQEHSMTWEISPAAALLAPAVTAELTDTPETERASPGGRRGAGDR